MARRFNLDTDMDLALEGYNFENLLGNDFAASLDFETAFIANATPLSLFTQDFNSTSPFDIADVHKRGKTAN